MGWLFAVALGMHRKSRAAVFAALPPIALGHALSIAMVAAGVLAAGLLLDRRTLHIMSAVVLIGWALYHYVYGRRHRVRVGMQASQAGLVLWSFLMATAHGAGVMILPALIPLCVSPSPAGGFIASNSLGMAFAGIAVHTAAMLVVIGAVATVVFEWVGLSILRSGWINLDLIWTAALAATGVLQLLLA
jgi:hypothetical protein